MTQRSLLAVPLFAIALGLASATPDVAMAQNKDQGSSSAGSAQGQSQSSSNQQQSATNNESGKASQSSQSDSSEKQGTQSSQNSSQSSQNSSQQAPSDRQTGQSSQNTSTSSNNNASSNQSNRDRDANRDSRQSDADRNRAPNDKTDANRSDDRSVLRDSNRDNQSDRRSDDRSDANRRSDDRGDRDRSRDSRRRDFKADFEFGQASSRGLTINNVVRDSIFFKSGLRNGDIIVSFNSHRIRNQDDFARFVIFEPGRRVPVVVFRNGREETIYVVFQDDQANIRQDGRAYFGAEFDQQINDAAIIVRVDQGSPADRAGLQRDDMVIALNGDRVSSPRDAMEIIGSMNAGDHLRIEYTRHGRTEATLEGSGRNTTTTEARAYQTTTEQSGVIQTGARDEVRRSDANRDQNSQDRDRRVDRRSGRGILPRLRN